MRIGFTPIVPGHSLPLAGPPEDFRHHTPTVIQVYCDWNIGISIADGSRQQQFSSRRENERFKRVWRELDLSLVDVSAFEHSQLMWELYDNPSAVRRPDCDAILDCIQHSRREIAHRLELRSGSGIVSSPTIPLVARTQWDQRQFAALIFFPGQRHSPGEEFIGSSSVVAGPRHALTRRIGVDDTPVTTHHLTGTPLVAHFDPRLPETVYFVEQRLQLLPILPGDREPTTTPDQLETLIHNLDVRMLFHDLPTMIELNAKGPMSFRFDASYTEDLLPAGALSKQKQIEFINLDREDECLVDNPSVGDCVRSCPTWTDIQGISFSNRSDDSDVPDLRCVVFVPFLTSPVVEEALPVLEESPLAFPESTPSANTLSASSDFMNLHNTSTHFLDHFARELARVVQDSHQQTSSSSGPALPANLSWQFDFHVPLEATDAGVLAAYRSIKHGPCYTGLLPQLPGGVASIEKLECKGNCVEGRCTCLPKKKKRADSERLRPRDHDPRITDRKTSRKTIYPTYGTMIIVLDRADFARSMPDVPQPLLGGLADLPRTRPITSSARLILTDPLPVQPYGPGELVMLQHELQAWRAENLGTLAERVLLRSPAQPAIESESETELDSEDGFEDDDESMDDSPDMTDVPSAQSNVDSEEQYKEDTYDATSEPADRAEEAAAQVIVVDDAETTSSSGVLTPIGTDSDRDSTGTDLAYDADDDAAMQYDDTVLEWEDDDDDEEG